MERKNAREDYFEVLELNIEGMRIDSVIYTGSRIDPNTVSDNLHIYEVREDDYGELRAIEPAVAVNFGGSIISIDEIPLGNGEDKYLELTDENLGYEGWECAYDDYANYMNYVLTCVDEPISFAEWDDTLNH